MDYFEKNRNITSYAIAFCTSYWDDRWVTLPCNFGKEFSSDLDFFFYSLMYNTTLVTESIIENYTETYIFDSNLLRLKQGMDSGIMDYQRSKNSSMQDTPEIEITASHYPTAGDRSVQDLNITAFMGSYWFNFPCLLTFLAVVILMMDEKELKLRQGLNVVGVSQALYWAHWIITFL